MIAIYVFGALLVLLLAGVTLAPLLEREPPDVPLEELPAGERRSVALEALRELEFEHETGKMNDDEYRRERARWGRMALDALDELESAGADATGTGAVGTAGRPEVRCRSCGSAQRARSSFCARCGARLGAGAGESA